MSDEQRIEKWFDHLEQSLEAEAQIAGLLEHGSMIGAGREFLVRRVLSSILPSSVHVGTGRIIDARGNASRQVDIILYDSRLPVFEVDRGFGLYPIEGVLAAIEVKSTLTKRELEMSLVNTASIIRLTVGVDPPTRWEDRVKHLVNKHSFSKQEAQRRAFLEFMPSTYVFAFHTKTRTETLANNLEKWFIDCGMPAVGDGSCPVLPRIIVAGRKVGILDDGFITVDPGPDIWKQWREQHGEDVRHLMSFWDTERRFGWLASSVLQSVTRRLGPEHASLGVRYDITRYLPLNSYFRTDMDGKKSFHVHWMPSESS